VTILACALERAARQAVLDRLVPLLVGVVGFAAGSSSVPRALNVGHPLRWVLLAALVVAAGAWGMPVRRPTRPDIVAAVGLLAVALLSTAWSVEPRTTFERACSLVLLFAACALLAEAVRGRPDRARAVLAGVAGGAVVVGLAGLLVLAVAHGDAVTAASTEAPARYRGFGQDPNTVALLFAVAVPLATWGALTASRRSPWLLTLALFVGTIVASGSRGALAAATAGALIVVAAASAGRARILVAAAVVVLAVAGAGIEAVPKATSSNPTAAARAAGPVPRSGYLNAEQSYPLDADVGQPLPGGGQPPVTRSFFGGSGRLDAWRGALHEAARRPLVGHGFGTEQAVFVDRYYRFVGGLPENSYIGLALQLGVVGLLALAVLVAVLARSGLRGRRRAHAAAGLGVLAAGLVAAVGQSYLYSAGNIAAAALWIPVFLLGTVGDA
jgi:O-antigen ligase